MDLTSGQNTTLPTGRTVVTVNTGTTSGYDADVSVFVLGADGRVRGDADMIFHGQKRTPGGEIVLEQTAGRTTVTVQSLPAGAARVVIAIAGDDLAGNGRDLSAVKPITLDVSASDGQSHRFEPTETSRRALVLVEIYERNGSLRIKAVGQGFDGGLAPLARSYGVDVDDAAPPPSPPPPKVDLRKQRLVSLEKDQPRLVELAKTAAVSLEKTGLTGTTAKVKIVLDISASMTRLYHGGAIARLVERVLGLSLNLDDDGNIDAYAFGTGAHDLGEIDVVHQRSFIPDMLKRYSLEGGTYYGKVMRLVRKQSARDPSFGRIPVFVIFITDGNTQDPRVTEEQIKDASREGIFWKAIAIGQMPHGILRKRSTLPMGFDFLQMLDDMPGRTVDNLDFFSVEDPDHPTDAELYAMMLEEYPEWLKAARAAGILA